MQRNIKGLVFFICLMSLAACSKSDDPDDHVFNTQTGALDKAKNVENTLRDADQTRRQNLD